MSLYPNSDKHTQWWGPAVYDGNEPEVVVIHVGQGWIGTWDNWAASGYDRAAFHAGASLKGKLHTYLNTNQGGAHAGIIRNPTAKLIDSLRPYVNLKSVGIEHEGFSNGKSPEGIELDQWNDAQLRASADFVRWVCDEHGIPKDRDHIIGHNEIDGVNRANDPGPLFPWERYMALVLEEDMSPEDRLRLERLELALFSGREEGSETRETRLANAQFRAALRDTPGDPAGWRQSISEQLEAHTQQHPGNGAGVAEHSHHTTVTQSTTGGVVK